MTKITLIVADNGTNALIQNIVIDRLQALKRNHRYGSYKLMAKH